MSHTGVEAGHALVLLLFVHVVWHAVSAPHQYPDVQSAPDAHEVLQLWLAHAYPVPHSLSLRHPIEQLPLLQYVPAPQFASAEHVL